MALPAIVPVLGAVASAVGALAPKKTESAGRLGKDDFLKLLIAQLQNQNPLNPMSNDQFIAQSAQFTSLEELQNIRKSLDTMSAANGNTSLTGTAALLGRSVKATAAGFTYAGATVTLPFTLEEAASGATLEVLDGGGNVVSQIPLGARAAGAQTASFQPGQALPAGQYRYRIVAPDASGRTVALAAITGTVSGISLEGGAQVLALGSRKVLLSDVAALSGATN